MKGRRPKPTQVKLREGNVGHRRLDKNEPKPRPGAPTMPFKLSGRALAHWKRLVPIMLEMKVLTVADGDVLARYCSTLATWELAAAAVKRYGLFVMTRDEKTGQVAKKLNPALRAQQDAARELRHLEGETGLTPASRARLQVRPADEVDSLADFLDGKSKDDVVQ